MREYNGQLIRGDWDPIISGEEWQAVKAILEDPSRYRYERGGVAKYLLSGMVYCSLRGNKLSLRKVRRKRVYDCSPVAPKGGCGRISRAAEPLENLVTAAIFYAVEADVFERLAAQGAPGCLTLRGSLRRGGTGPRTCQHQNAADDRRVLNMLWQAL